MPTSCGKRRWILTKRTLIKVTLPDVIAADHMFTMLMGEDVPPRRAFIEQHALSVKNLDI